MPDLILQGFILATGVAGQLLVAHRNPLGFWAWIASNFALIWVSVDKGLLGMAGLYCFYSLMCVYSIRQWAKSESTVPAKG